MQNRFLHRGVRCRLVVVDRRICNGVARGEPLRRLARSIANDFEIGSTLIMKVTRIETDDSALGSYSLEDGSMAGAYGDGEYAN